MTNKENFNVLYIDDSIDPYLSLYLNEYLQKDKYFAENNINLTIKEYKFKNEKYEDLLQEEEIKRANIIIIDSMLFKDQDTCNNKFTGEEFSIILKNLNSCVYVIVITQNNLLEQEKFGMIRKFVYTNDSTEEDIKKQYDKDLKSIIIDRIKQLKYDREKIKKLDENKNIDKIVVEKINNLLSGTYEYNKLSKKDIDDFIKEFKNIEDLLKEQHK